MKISPEYLIERKKNIAHLTRWKILSLLLIFVLITFLMDFLPDNPITPSSVVTNDYIAAIEINEIITDDLERVRKLKELAEDKKVKAVIVHINSPGGSVVGSEMLYNSFLKIGKEKPIISVFGSVAASGGYLAALGTDYIICHHGTLTGSIGVVMQSAEITELAEKLGVSFTNFKSSAFKASPNPMEKLTLEVKEAMMDNVYDVYDYFVDIVATRRNLSRSQLAAAVDGRVFSGGNALELGLVDQIGGEDEAIKWLQEIKSINPSLKVRKYVIKAKTGFIDTLFTDFEEKISLGLNGIKSIYRGF